MHLLSNITWYKGIQPLLLVLLAGTLSCKRTLPIRVLIETESGNLVVEVYPERAPVTAGNFLSLAEQGAFTGAIFYRVVRLDNQPNNQVKIEVIQGGLFHEERINQYEPIVHETTRETGIRHTDGIISMARNSPGTASTEFFICIGDQPSLDSGGDRNPDGQGFAAFGKVVEGMEIVRAIQLMPDREQMLVQPVKIRRMTLIR